MTSGIEIPGIKLGVAIAGLAGAAPDDEERSDPGGEADREGRKDDVERDGEGELQSRKQDRIVFHD